MAKRADLRPADLTHINLKGGANERYARFVLGMLQHLGYDHLRRQLPVDGRASIGKSTLRDFADQSGILYQSLWVSVRGVSIPKDDFVVTLAGALGLRKRDEVALLLLIAHQARMPEPYDQYLEPAIADLAERTGLAPLVHGL